LPISYDREGGGYAIESGHGAEECLAERDRLRCAAIVGKDHHGLCKVLRQQASPSGGQLGMGEFPTFAGTEQ
jgi:hypothetical protein